MTAAILLAAGAGSRMGASVPKVMLPLAGRPALFWPLRAFQECPAVDAVCVVAAPALREELQGLLPSWGMDKVRYWADGGMSRGGSVRNGLEALPQDTEFVAIHDGARPLVTPEDIEKTLEAAKVMGAAVLGFPAVDTIQETDASGRIVRTPDRARLWQVQTPQCFAFGPLREAYRRAALEGFDATDDAAVMRRAGCPVTLVQGRTDNFKLTRPEDVPLCEAVLRQREGDAMRIGMGYDVHKLVEGRPLILGGVRMEYPLGLLGHSDADVLTHAVMDALLGAAALGDIGMHFPDTDPRYAGADSLHLLCQVGRLLAEHGWRVGNIDATVICQRPKIAPFRQEMATRMARALGISPGQVSVKGTTTEGLGFPGRGEGIAAQAVASLVQN